MKQFSFEFVKDYRKEFGGSLLYGKRKSKRPISTKLPTHLVLRANKSSYFRPYDRTLDKLFRSVAFKYGIKIYDLSFNWSHIHALIKIPSREAYIAFIRVLNSKMIQYLSTLFKTKLKTIFTLRPFTRILSWGREFRTVKSYHDLNSMEARGLIFRAKAHKKSTKKAIIIDAQTINIKI